MKSTVEERIRSLGLELPRRYHAKGQLSFLCHFGQHALSVR